MKQTRKLLACAFLIVTGVAAPATHAHAQQLLNFQGKLQSGETPKTGTFSLTFTIYVSPSGGAPLWSETQQVTVNNDIFGVLLGSVNPLPNTVFADGGERYLGIQVAGETEMTPRLQLLTVGVAKPSPNPSKTITGTVRDINTYREIRDVNIFIKDTQIGTITDHAGRFTLNISDRGEEMIVVFRHIAYEPLEIAIYSLAQLAYVNLQPRVIQLKGVEVVGVGERRLEIEKDLPQTVSLLEAKNFEIRGYVDAGDLLKTDHSVQVDEELSGKKTASIRGGNPDEVVVMYNGVKMNSAYDNTYDLSLVDLEDIDRFEIIKGSNTALYGPEAFSGVINIVPKIEQDYTLRFQQRLGTYRSGNWGVHLYQKLNRLHGSYSFKRGGTKRSFLDDPTDQLGLENTSLHHTANLVYALSDGRDGRPGNRLSVMYIYTALDYENRRDTETLTDFNQLVSLKYNGDIFFLRDLDLSTSWRRLSEDQFLATGTGALSRAIDDQAILFDAEKHQRLGLLDFLFAYQFENARLDFKHDRGNFVEQSVGLRSADLFRVHHGLVSIAKLHGVTDSDFLQTIDVDVSVRHDIIHDSEENVVLRSGGQGILDSLTGFFGNNDWRKTMFKFALNLYGYKNDLAFNGYMSFGLNTKFPTLFQQISSPDVVQSVATQPNLNPEKNRSLEVGMVFSRDIRGQTSIYGWQLSVNYFQNFYDNKFRTYSTPGIPVVFYDNVQTARISGVESKASVFLFRKKVTVETGLSKYFISEKAAFPFKSDLKRTINFNVDHAGYAFQVHWFMEGSQVGWIRQFKELRGVFARVDLPSYNNIDVHMSKTFERGKLKWFVNASGRNLLNSQDTVLQGLAIRDRRYYITLGAQY